MATTKKALAIRDELIDALRKRVSNYGSIVEGFDSSGNPTIALNDGTAATTEDNVFIRVTPRDWALTKDILGSAQQVYTPHVIQLAVETSATATGIMDYASVAHAIAILGEVVERGCRFEYWEETNGTIPSATTFDTASKLKASYESLYWPMLSSQ